MVSITEEEFKSHIEDYDFFEKFGNPVYGDSIIGYITKGNGITVHRMNCHNLDMLENRTLEVHWNVNLNKRYLTFILIYTNDNNNYMVDLVQAISIMNVGIDGIKTLSKEENPVYEIGCYVTGLDQLNKLILNLNKEKYIDRVEREFR